MMNIIERIQNGLLDVDDYCEQVRDFLIDEGIDVERHDGFTQGILAERLGFRYTENTVEEELNEEEL